MNLGTLGRGPLKYSAATVAVTIDGNSLVAGSYSTSGANWPNTVLGPLMPFAGQITIANEGIAGQTFANMTSNHADVDAAWVAGKTNVLIAWETTNAVRTEGKTGAQAFADCAAYIAAVKAVHPWRVVLVTATPRYQAGAQPSVAVMNQAIIDCNNLMTAGFRGIGADAVADLRGPGSPFNLADYTVLSNYSTTYFSTNDGSDANGPIRVHFTDAGFAYAAGIIAAAAKRVRK